MSTAFRRLSRPARRWVVSAMLLVFTGLSSTVWAAFFRQAVGGISINPQGVLVNAEKDNNGLRQFWLDNLQPVPGDLNQSTKLRKISLRGLAEVVGKLAGQPQLPDEVRFLAGLQRVEYVLVYPEQNDIVLVGYGEGWKVDERGNVVGATTGRPVMQLDDLLVALRTADAAARGGITCSIDPTEAGLARAQKVQAQILQPNVSPKDAADALRTALGPQMISFRGVPPKSRFAHILLAADFRMKRLAMHFDPTPIKGLPSYLTMLKRGKQPGVPNILPRWWLTTDYEPLLTDGKGLAWQLRGQGVKCMSEDDFVAADGTRQRLGKSSKEAQRWADLMTKHYDALSVKEPIFGELRNCMDLAVVAALIFKENLAGRAALDLGALIDAEAYPTEEFNVPKQVDTKVSYIETANSYLLSASGGVELTSWQAAAEQETSDDLASLRGKLADDRGDLWWWN